MPINTQRSVTALVVGKSEVVVTNSVARAGRYTATTNAGAVEFTVTLLIRGERLEYEVAKERYDAVALADFVEVMEHVKTVERKETSYRWGDAL